MTLRKKYVNSTLENKKCYKCKEMFPRTEEYFYPVKNRKIGVKSYASYCITCDNQRAKEYKKNLTTEQKKTSQQKYVESERGYFMELWGGIRTSIHGNQFKDFEEFFNCWIEQEKKYGLKCPYYPHIEMTRVKGKGKITNTNISKDRILSSMPYGPKNIMFICWKANNEKGNVTPYLAARYLDFVENSEYCKKMTEFELETLEAKHSYRNRADIDLILDVVDHTKKSLELFNSYAIKFMEMARAEPSQIREEDEYEDEEEERRDH